MIKKQDLFGAIVAVTASILMGATTARAADARNGEELAKRWCSSCHLIEAGQTQASTDAPSFSAIAQKSEFTAEKVAFFLLDPHPKMPSFPLSRNEAADLAAYIASFRK